MLSQSSVKTSALIGTSLSAKDQNVCAMLLGEGIVSKVWALGCCSTSCYGITVSLYF